MFQHNTYVYVYIYIYIISTVCCESTVLSQSSTANVPQVMGAPARGDIMADKGGRVHEPRRDQQRGSGRHGACPGRTEAGRRGRQASPPGNCIICFARLGQQLPEHGAGHSPVAPLPQLRGAHLRQQMVLGFVVCSISNHCRRQVIMFSHGVPTVPTYAMVRHVVCRQLESGTASYE